MCKIANCQSGTWGKPTSGAGAVSNAQWSSTYDGLCTVKIYAGSSQWNQLCYDGATNHIGVYLWYPTITTLYWSKPLGFNCASASSNGRCDDVGGSGGVGNAYLIPTPTGIKDNWPNSSTPIYPWQ
ncbi:MAG: hypothetical protein M1300_07490 [Epsilonproteobacteria bacterium]|nr:hypothetical protein [Campylobacterota bacterium]